MIVISSKEIVFSIKSESKYSSDGRCSISHLCFTLRQDKSSLNIGKITVLDTIHSYYSQGMAFLLTQHSLQIDRIQGKNSKA